jgi:fatty acid desaturase
VAVAAALVVVQYARPETALFILPISCYLAIAIGTITHNHNHCATFAGRRTNNAFGHLLTVFYGYPTIMWIPTHNQNHHRLVNRPGDATITWRYTNKHNLFVAATYFFVSSYFQSEPIKRYIRRAKLHNRHLYGRIILQYSIWLGFLGLMMLLGVRMHGLRTGLLVWLAAVVIPPFCSLSLIMFFNYIQHVHADAWSEHDHSRNFTGKVFNFLFFNNGYHTAHHEQPGLHWSALPTAHARIAASINPRLNEGNLLWFFVKQYGLAWVFPRFGTRQLGLEPLEAAAAACVVSLPVEPVSLPVEPVSLPMAELCPDSAELADVSPGL